MTANARELVPILQRAAEERASDVLLTAGAAPVVYLGSRILRVGTAPLTAAETQAMLYSVLDSEQVARFERERELDFSFSLNEATRFRGNAYWQRGSVGAAFRLIRNDIPSFAELGLPPVVAEFADAAQGLVLVTGPTGHGKSTTLASLIDHVNRNRSCHIVTIEDPIEFVHTHRRAVIDQREVGSDTLSFAAAVRHVLRQAPHIILVGEMRDLETIRTVLTAAETGHLVFATLHTNDAAQTVERIIDVFPAEQQPQVRMQLSMALLAVVSQRLLPGMETHQRVLACEIMRAVPAITNLIREGKPQQIASAIETHGRHGMRTLDAHIRQLYLDGAIDETTARKAMVHPATIFGG